MKNLRIVLDCDGVLAQTMEEVIRLFNREHGRNVRLSDITSWDLPHKEMYGYFTRKGFFAGLKTIPHARDIVRALAAKGDEIVVATATYPEMWEERKEWVKRFFPEIKDDNILRKEDKSDVEGDIMLDDGVHNLETSVCANKVLFDQPWNRNEHRFLRVSNWLEFAKFVESLRAESRTAAAKFATAANC